MNSKIFPASGINYSQIKSKRGFSLKLLYPKICSTTLKCLIYFVFGIKFKFMFFFYKCRALRRNMLKPHKSKPRWGKSLSPVLVMAVRMWRYGKSLHGTEVWNPIFFSSLLFKERNILCSDTVRLKNKLIWHIRVREVFTWAWNKYRPDLFPGKKELLLCI